MEQLKMYRLPGKPVVVPPVPEGYSITKYQTEEDQDAWLACCTNGQLIDETIGREAFRSAILGEGIDPCKDVYFLDHDGEYIATSTCYMRRGENVGDLHMVGMRTEWRGKGLAKCIIGAALANPAVQNSDYIVLTTDDFRPAAVRTYLAFGFLPVEYDTGMVERWEKMLGKIGVEQAEMLNEDCSHFMTLHAVREEA